MAVQNASRTTVEFAQPAPLLDRAANAARQHPDVTLVILLVLLALAVRLPALGTVPNNITADEADNFQFVLRVLEGKDPSLFGLDWKPAPAFSVHLMSWSASLLGATVTSLRLPSAVLSALTLIPFYFLARRHTRKLAAFFAALLLSNSLWFLHFSRSAWENVHVAFFAAMAAWMITLALERGRLIFYALTGVFAALGLYGYFSGRLIIVALLAFLPVAISLRRDQARRILTGYALLVAVAFVLFAPQLPAVLQDWDTFNYRTTAVAIWQQPRPYAGQSSLLGILWHQVTITAQSFSGLESIGGSRRYFPPDRGLFDALVALSYTVGLVIGFRRARQTALWWPLFLIPLVATQVFSADTPDLARAVIVAPFAFLYVALGLERLLLMRGTLAGALQLTVLAGALFASYDNVSAYVHWMAQPATAQAREPAVAVAEIDAWMARQRVEIAAGRRGLNVQEWQRVRPALPPVSPPRDIKPVAIPRLPERLEAKQLPAEWLATLGHGEGGAPGQFLTPRGVAVDAAGNVFVADSGNSRIQRIGTDGRAEVLGGKAVEPVDLALSPGGELFVVDARNQVLKFDARGNFVLSFGANAGMYHPRGIAVDRNGLVYVADTGRDRIVVFGADGVLLRSIEGGDRFKQPTDVAVDHAGNTFVVDPTNRQLVKLDARGMLVYRNVISSANTVDGPHLALRPDGFPLATDPHGRRIVTFDYDGRVAGAVGSESDPALRVPVGIALDAKGHVYLADAAFAAIKVLRFGQ